LDTAQLSSALLAGLYGFIAIVFFPKELNSGTVADGTSAAPTFNDTSQFAAFGFRHVNHSLKTSKLAQ